MLQNVSRLSEGYAFPTALFSYPCRRFLLNIVRGDPDGGTQTEESRERYADDAQFGAWSRDSIYAMREIGIMKGEENNAFHPAGGDTGEQALVTMERLYNKLHQ